MRCPVVALCLLVLAQPSARVSAAAEGDATVVIERLWTAFREADSFQTIREFRTGTEDAGDTVILRSRPEAREGFYFTLRLVARGPREAQLPDGRIELQVIAPDGAQPRTFRYPLALDSRRSAHLELGVTGSDWLHRDQLPLAWKLDVVATDGRVLASRQSFLWEKPTDPR